MAFLFRIHLRYAFPLYNRCFRYLYGDDFKANGRAKFHAHNEKIRSLVPQDRLLEFHLGDGWDPLCKFLDVAKLDVEYPIGNTVGDLNENFNALLTYGWKLALVRLSKWTLIGVAAVYAISLLGKKLQ